MVTVLKTLRNHWKKSIFAVVAFTFGGRLIKEKIEINAMMRAYCEEALGHGNSGIGVTGKPRHVTVILNPAAKNGKGKKLYEDYCSPLLNLAGIRVSLISTEHEAQARDMMELMENTDAVIVAGGDGTLHEAVTGMLRRNDQASERLILGLAPIGRNNKFAKLIFKEKFTSEAQLLAETTMAVIKQTFRPVDVIKIQGSSNKPVYALNKLEFGTLRDTDTLIQKYWYFGFLKEKITYLLSGIIRVPSLPFNITLSYVHPCSGCSRCFVKRVNQPQHVTKKWWSTFIPKTKSIVDSKVEEEIDLSHVINEDCGQWIKEEMTCSNLSFITNSLTKDERTLKAFIVEPLETRAQFIKKGWNRHSRGSNNTEGKEIDLAEAKLEMAIVQDLKQQWLSIDNENYEAQECIQLSLLPSKVFIYSKI